MKTMFLTTTRTQALTRGFLIDLWNSHMSVSCFHVGLSWVPILLAMTLSSTLFISYILAIYKGSVEPDFPMISATGAVPPESCIFSQGLNMSAFLSLLCCYIWYGIASQQTKYMGTKQPRCLLKWCRIAGIIGSLGLSIVGNFQQKSVEVVHVIGAVMAFIGSIAYILITTHLCRRYLGYHSYYWAPRLCIGIGCILSGISFVGCKMALHLKNPDRPSRSLARILPSDPVYAESVCSSSSEWILGFLIIIFFLTLAPEFRRYALQLPELVGSSVVKQEET
ncbi:hypothetical protein P879_02197 [Paragonimus westermani]|uniref:CWH43-like N-terminal domain-containing protein n=1 Tax=Paragonimus westermani TaxID=34504 RepID=A0A8T0DM39_9TREM|nr:hypothetical protein P879_02197 [Paragonimus westermani]